MSTLFNGDTLLKSQNGTDPKWFQNTQRRTITNHLVPKRKAGLQITAKKDLKNTKSSTPTEYNLVNFGLSQRNLTGLDKYDTSSGDISKYQDTLTELVVPSNGDDLPPGRSIYDLNDEVLISLNRPSNQNANSFINKDPKSFSNAFGAAAVAVEPKKATPLTDESAVVVFGYPEVLSSQIIAHFQELGNVLEPFEGKHKNTSFLKERDHHLVPILSGPSWVKITYDNPASAVDALQENGSVFNGAPLGVIPYLKAVVEKLQKRKLTDEEDVGQLDVDALPKAVDPVETGDNTYLKRLDIKDGSALFLKANSDPSKPDEKKDDKIGLVGRATRFLFGFNEL